MLLRWNEIRRKEEEEKKRKIITLPFSVSNKISAGNEEIFSLEIIVDKSLPIRNNPSSVDKRRVFRRKSVQLNMDFYRDSHSLRIAYPPAGPIVFRFFNQSFEQANKEQKIN